MGQTLAMLVASAKVGNIEIMLSRDSNHWSRYNQVQVGRPVRPLLTQALSCIGASRGRALDVGAGAGIESKELLAQGFDVLSVEPTRTSGELISQAITQANPEWLSRWELAVSPIQDIDLEPSHFCCIYAGFSLPYCPPEAFADVWGRLLTSLAPGGLIAVDLFGPEDSWAQEPDISSVERSWLEESLRGLQVHRLEEHAYWGKTFSGEKFWHTFEVIAQVPAASA